MTETIKSVCPVPALPEIVLIATGGTIAMRYEPGMQASIPSFSGDDLVSFVPGIASLARLSVHSLFTIPSEHMAPVHWCAVQQRVAAELERPEVAGVIVSHGTDTMEETAYFLDLTLQTEKPVVLVGAQRSASERDYDGPRNLLNAVRLCIAPEARNLGAVICMNDQINAAREASKTSTSEVETFKSGDFGFLGQVDPDAVRLYRRPLRRQHIALLPGDLPRVDIIASYAGADGSLIRASAASGAKGLVVAGLGCGNVPETQFEALCELRRQGVCVVMSSRVPNGRVFPLYGYAGGGRSLQEAGVVFADNLSPQHARVFLMLALQHKLMPQRIQELMQA